MKATLVYQEPESAYKTRITFSVYNKDLHEVPNECDLIIKKHHPQRSTDLNAMYWANLRTLANMLDTSLPEAHNIIMQRYGTFDTDADGNLIKVVMKDSFDYEKSEDLHLYPTKFTTELDGVQYRLFYKMKNSSSLNTVEFSKLLDGLKSELDEINNAD